MTAFRDPRQFPFVEVLERAFADILAELLRLDERDFAPSDDSLTTVAEGYDETGWTWFWLHGGGDAMANRARCPATSRALDTVPGLVNAGFSRFRAGTHLYPHHGEMPGVLRCHLALVVPRGDVAIRFGEEVGRWQVGRCLIFDDTVEHDAWNRGEGDRVVLLMTFATPVGSPPRH